MTTTPEPPPPDKADPAPRRDVDRWSGARVDARAVRGSFIGMALMAMLLFVFLASVTIVPWWAIAVITVLWLFALVQGTRWFMTQPRKVLALPFVLLAVWLVLVAVSVAVGDWGS